MRLLVCLLVCPAALAANSFNCPPTENTGYFADPDQCDKYWDCDRGLATARLCPDGMAFSERARRNTDPCVLHWLAGCQGRTLQAPNGTLPCDRQNGYFAHEDPSNCIDYYHCLNNVPSPATCAPGLVFNPRSHGCDWPTDANREGCNTRASVDGFTCPNEIVLNSNGLREQHPRYNDRNDCRSFFVCLEGVTPQKVRCPLGEVFSENLNSCTLAEFVPGCEDYYKDHPLRNRFKDADGDGRIDVNLEAFSQF
ncbi:Protein obstructor-E [Amphibalanus amphitrite]|uniref:Protein obstructor-E n=1 Tax=Amphibalanus amphitrite TaxID=1232801 RepID=A0A6A4W3I2_AMPAM|nr:protein obstructor-E-like [Amphibalanus amphitrite]KAF0299849.1 Protein obstructor-E [Amphibalanus amphitrite]